MQPEAPTNIRDRRHTHARAHTHTLCNKVRAASNQGEPAEMLRWFKKSQIPGGAHEQVVACRSMIQWNKRARYQVRVVSQSKAMCCIALDAHMR